ncbi:DegT/DnrJ/EryC1/StrS aminotransferase family protein [Pelagibius sp. Alg239-R121]|uniref:DegT/DnrJ/EryC1/StrS family aminotransferase n=1 Tax=Pelagibius sp. Alg239-R121 TaxID=2993448 RepID=UPI0024A62E6E|nr:DegT/DnrJ/EryC1/StrS family aminotransferase [Pelagibius sp. Alg239-R121]
MSQILNERSFNSRPTPAANDTAVAPVPVMRPRLPAAEEIFPYLSEIDANHWYSNFGPLACRFEDRLSAHFTDDTGCVAAVSNGTVGLILALKALAPLPGDLCMLPAFTFTASASAVLAAGLVPWFVDVDPLTWALEPGRAKDYLKSAPGRVAAIMPVSVFGRPVAVSAWDELSLETSIPVVIDGAASFDGAEVGQAPVILSLHGTKVFGVGEGGAVLSTNKALISEVHSLSNFGFPMSLERKAAGRSALLPGINGKFSEYSAAVGLAGLDSWSATRQRFLEVRDAYLDALADLPALQPQPGGCEDWVSATINFSIRRARATSLIFELDQRGIQARRWWGDGCHAAPAFSSYPQSDLPVTEGLVDSVIGLPFYVGMTRDEILRVRAALAECLE